MIKRFCYLILLLLSPLMLPAQNTTDTYAMRRAVEAWQQSDYQTAYNALSQELNNNPKNGMAYAVLSFICNEVGAPSKMLRFANQAVEYLPKNDQRVLPEVLMMLANFYWTAEDTVEAEQYLARALKVAPKFYKVYNRYEQFYTKTERYQDMVNLGIKAIQMLPGEVDGFTLLFEGYMGTQQYEKALQTADEIVRISAKHENAAKMLPYAYEFRVRALFQLKQYDEALHEALTTLAVIQTGDLLNAVIDIADSTDMDRVIDSLRVYEKRYEGMPWWGLMRGQIYVDNKRPAEGYVEFYRAMQIQDMDHVWRKMAAIAANELNDLSRAKICHDRAIKADSTNAVNYIVAADYYYNDLRDIATGDAMVEQAIRLNPLHGSPYLLRAYRWMVAGEYEKAIDDYYCALVADPELVEFYFRIARAYRALGDSEKLQQVKDKACALYRSLGRELRADEYYGLGEFDKACEKAAEDVTERSTQNTCYNTACIYALSGRNDEAVEYLRQAVEKGFLAIPHMNHDIDLDGLRAMPAFQQLMQECEAKTAEMRRIVDEQLTEDKQ